MHFHCGSENVKIWVPFIAKIRSFSAHDGLGLTVRVWLGFGRRGSAYRFSIRCRLVYSNWPCGCVAIAASRHPDYNRTHSCRIGICYRQCKRGAKEGIAAHSNLSHQHPRTPVKSLRGTQIIIAPIGLQIKPNSIFGKETSFFRSCQLTWHMLQALLPRCGVARRRKRGDCSAFQSVDPSFRQFLGNKTPTRKFWLNLYSIFFQLFTPQSRAQKCFARLSHVNVSARHTNSKFRKISVFGSEEEATHLLH
eukprot:sb/3468758/